MQAVVSRWHKAAAAVVAIIAGDIDVIVAAAET